MNVLLSQEAEPDRDVAVWESRYPINPFGKKFAGMVEENF